MINKQIYRQGFILKTTAFLDHLAANYFAPQPMAAYTGLQLCRLWIKAMKPVSCRSVWPPEDPEFVLNRTFPSPFSFLSATLTCDQIPRSTGRRTLTIMIVVLAVIVMIGLFAIYQSARTIVDLSERRSQFVSSVTHELKDAR